MKTSTDAAIIHSQCLTISLIFSFVNLHILLPALLLTGSLTAQIPSIDWSYHTGAPAFGSAAAADLDGDGFYEIVFTTYTNDGRAHCLNAEDGSVKWIYDIGGCGDVAPLIYDADNDDTLDVIINGSCNPTLFCINGATGQLIWSVPSGGGDSPPTVANIDADTFPEFFFCNFNGQLRIVNGENGSVNKTIQVDPNGSPIQTEPSLVDVNADGRLDIIMASHFNLSGLYVWAYDYISEDTIWTNLTTDSSTYNAYHSGAVADVDGNGDLEYVIGSNNGLVRALNVQNGSVLWSRSIPKSCMAAISIADLDGDGTLEVVVTNNDWVTLDERIWVLDGFNGNTEWSYATTFSSFRGCAIADINGNDTLDLVAGYFMGDVIAVEPYNGLLWNMNLLPQFPSNLPYLLVDHGPLVADFDQSGTMDVFVVAGYGTYTPDSLNTGKAFMIEAGSGSCPEWLMFRHDVLRTGYLPQSEIDSVCIASSVPQLAAGNALFSVYPQPADELVYVECSAGAAIEILDATGKVVMRAVAGTSKWELNISQLPAGCYIVSVADDARLMRAKLIVE
ncbi:MAG: FG-GAP-like repeat-containing protein [Bacteroidia bacterium]|nr:FG-GAP-like repeat-containing protein [Bacteroidia bacterium]